MAFTIALSALDITPGELQQHPHGGRPHLLPSPHRRATRQTTTTKTRMAGNRKCAPLRSTAWRTARRRCSAMSTATRSRADGKKMLVKIDKDYAIIDLPKDKLETKDHKHQAGRARHAARSPRGVEADLLRSLAADARLLLRAEHERRRLEGDARQIRRAAALRESSQRSHLPHRRADRAS